MKLPTSMDECVYYTIRDLDLGKGEITCWVFKQKCPKCGKELMGKPKDKKGKKLIRAKEYVCPACNYSVEKEEYETSLTAQAIYTCPSCRKKGEGAVPFKRKKVDGIDTLQFVCSSCNAKLNVTKKMKQKGIESS